MLRRSIFCLKLWSAYLSNQILSLVDSGWLSHYNRWCPLSAHYQFFSVFHNWLVAVLSLSCAVHLLSCLSSNVFTPILRPIFYPSLAVCSRSGFIQALRWRRRGGGQELEITYRMAIIWMTGATYQPSLPSVGFVQRTMERRLAGRVLPWRTSTIGLTQPGEREPSSGQQRGGARSWDSTPLFSGRFVSKSTWRIIDG